MVLELITLGGYMLFRGALTELHKREAERQLAAQRSLSLSNDSSSSSLTSRETLYKKFPVSPSETRFLGLEPGTGDIHCTLFTKPLSESHNYDAISYTWGERTQDRYVYVQGIRFEVTDNLFDALLQFREAPGGNTKVVWVDALCINQAKESVEKKHQIDNMHRIYMNADTVLIWLGQAREGCARAIHLFAPLEGGNISDTALMKFYHASDRETWIGLLRNFVLRLWWSRGWIVQEVMLAKRPIMHSGQYSLSFDLVLQLTKIATDFDDGILSLIPKASIIPPMDNVQLPLAAMRFYRERIQAGNKLPFDHWLLQFGTQKTTEPADRIHAFIGLGKVSDPDLPISAQGKKPLEVIWAQATRYVLQKFGNLDFISLGHGPGRCEDQSLPNNRQMDRRKFELPSWVPDYTLQCATVTSLKPLPLRVTKSSVFNASLGRKPLIRFAGELMGHSDTRKLLASGIEIDTISSVTGINELCGDFTDDYLAQLSSPRGSSRFVSKTIYICDNYKKRTDSEAGLYVDPNPLRSSADQLQNLASGSDYHGFGCSWLEALGKTLTMDMRFSGIRLQPGQHYFNLPEDPPADFRLGMGDPRENKRMWMISLHAERHAWTSGRGFFITKKGYIGIGPPGMTFSDVICILDGASVPFVLRNADTAIEKQWEFVGECYLHGFMDGEAYQLNRCPNPTETFVIA